MKSTDNQTPRPRESAAQTHQEPLMSRVTKEHGVVVGIPCVQYRVERAKRFRSDGIHQYANAIGTLGDFSSVESWCTLGVDGEHGLNNSLLEHGAAAAQSGTSNFRLLPRNWAQSNGPMFS
jgi:hypothetical protein